MKKNWNFLVGICVLFSTSAMALEVMESRGHYKKVNAGGNKGFYLGHFDMAPELADCTDFGSGDLFRGGEPLFSEVFRAGSPSDLAVQTLQKNKIAIVIDLRSEGAFKRELAKETLEKHGIAYQHLAMYTSVPRGRSMSTLNGPVYQQEVKNMLARTLRYLRQGKNVYVHCQRGEDRSGTFIAMLRRMGAESCSWKREFVGYGGVMYAPLKDLFEKIY